MNEAFTHKLQQPITLPDQVITELKFPKMKGKYMRKFRARAIQEEAREAGAGAEMDYDQFMVMGEKMLADTYGPVTARMIFDEMEPDDVHEVVALVGERFAGGQTTGKTA